MFKNNFAKLGLAVTLGLFAAACNNDDENFSGAEPVTVTVNTERISEFYFERDERLFVGNGDQEEGDGGFLLKGDDRPDDQRKAKRWKYRHEDVIVAITDNFGPHYFTPEFLKGSPEVTVTVPEGQPVEVAILPLMGRDYNAEYAYGRLGFTPETVLVDDIQGGDGNYDNVTVANPANSVTITQYVSHNKAATFVTPPVTIEDSGIVLEVTEELYAAVIRADFSRLNPGGNNRDKVTDGTFVLESAPDQTFSLFFPKGERSKKGYIYHSPVRYNMPAMETATITFTRTDDGGDGYSKSVTKTKDLGTLFQHAGEINRIDVDDFDITPVER